MNRQESMRKLANLVQAERGLLPELVHDAMYRRTKVRLGIVYEGLASRARTQATFDCFVQHDLAQCKQNFYLASKLYSKAQGLDGWSGSLLGMYALCALLSDDEGVINDLAGIESPELLSARDNLKSPEALDYKFQLAILGRDRELGELIEETARKGSKADRQAISDGEYFFSLLLSRDSTKLKDLIEKRHANIRCAWPEFENFISYLGTIETKICWRRGIQIEIDHPLVPMELMPVKPLDHYDDVYDFLKPGWVPPPQGLFGRVSRWFKT
ncbi:contact-dependent inhibition immunity protein BcpI [Burkholderia multivorans]|uniref:Imm49 family immunity protein n=1 Tax=Burkholderia multivorans TaxID=87883 RepID=UPI001C275B26|nr:Imm49 family immunity protein [Burkholderia multivorans]MBU9345558.1 contact-dependent inhibition immunity protein BcpI [Burkholderia multivorans]